MALTSSLFYGGKGQFNLWLKGAFMVEMDDNCLDWWDLISVRNFSKLQLLN